MKTKILGTGSYLPRKILTNHDIAKFLDTSDEWIESRTGIRERHIVEKENCSDLALQASLAALKDAKISADEVEMIILATLTPEQRVPATSCILQDKLKAKNAAVYDIDVSCSGFVFALSIADQYIRNGSLKNILVVGSEVMSRVVDWKDRTTCILFGDGAGAAVLGPTPKNEHVILSTHLFSNGSLYRLLEIPGGGTREDWTHDALLKGDHFVRMQGKEVFREAVENMTRASNMALEKAGYTIQDVDLFIPHQANLRIMSAVSKKLQIPDEKVFINVDRCGNTSGASIAIALDEALKEKRIKKGDLVLIATFGAGFAWGSALIRW